MIELNGKLSIDACMDIYTIGKTAKRIFTITISQNYGKLHISGSYNTQAIQCSTEEGQVKTGSFKRLLETQGTARKTSETTS